MHACEIGESASKLIYSNADFMKPRSRRCIAAGGAFTVKYVNGLPRLIFTNVNTHLSEPIVFHPNVTLSIAFARLTSVNIRLVPTYPSRGYGL